MKNQLSNKIDQLNAENAQMANEVNANNRDELFEKFNENNKKIRYCTEQISVVSSLPLEEQRQLDAWVAMGGHVI